MRLRVNGRLEIENRRGYPDALVNALRRGLREGAPARPDPKRAGFYELDHRDGTFYFYLPHSNGKGLKKLLLLAHWTRQA